MRDAKTIITAFIISLTGHLLVLGMPWINMDFSTPNRLEHTEDEDIVVNIEFERPPLLPKIDTMGEEKKLKEKIVKKPLKEQIEESLIPEQRRIEVGDPTEEAMLRYQDMVKQRIESARKYPLWAKRQGIEGSAFINFTVLSNGMSRDIKIIRSSGYKILDEEAVKNVKRANPFPPIPEKIKTSSIKMDVSIVYTLK